MPRPAVRGCLRRFGGGDPLDDRRSILVAGVQPLEVDERDATVAAHAHGEVGIRHGIHGRRHEGDLQPQPADLDRQLDFGRVRGHRAGHQRHLVEAVGASQPIGCCANALPGCSIMSRSGRVRKRPRTA